MLQFKNLKLYQFVKGVRFQQNPKQPFVLIYFSENSTLIEDYNKLNIKKFDAKIVVVPITRIPVTRLTPELTKQYRKLGLYSYSSIMKIPANKNIIFDPTSYIKTVDIKYKVKTYRQRAGLLLNSVLTKAYELFPNYNKVLIYSTDTTKDINTFTNRRIFPIIQQIKSTNFDFDSLLLVTIGEDTKYRLLIKDKEYNYSKVLMYLKNIKITELNREEIDKASDEVIKHISDKLEPDNKEKVKNTISNYLEKDKRSLDKVISGDINKNDASEIATSSVLYNINGNLNKSVKVSKSIPDNKKDTAIKVIDKNLIDEVIPIKIPKMMSNNEVIKNSNIVATVDSKTPGHLFQKRQIDFETNLKKDALNSFKVLENKEVPLKVQSISIEPVKVKHTELNKSDTNILKTVLNDSFGNTHTVEIELPKIDPDSGTFRVYGEKKCLVNQIVQNPITFLKPYDSKFESSYSSFHIVSKRMVKGNYLEIYLGSSKLPLLVLLGFSFGFDKILKDFDIDYKIVTNKPSKDKIYVKIGNQNNYIIFNNINTDLKIELCNSLIITKVFEKYIINKEFGTKDYFNDLIISITGRVSSTYQILTNLENIIDPIVRQVLINLQLPYHLEEIIKYMATKVVTGFSMKRNDLSNQRIRGSEVLVHLAQKQILAAYTEYKEQVLAGNKEAKFVIPPKKLISDFIQLELVTNMEYANPIEEMSVLTRITPVGKSVGGIPDKEAIQVSARNVDPSYFGNIDPVDTPEGGNIGMVQQLTINSFITSARGLIHTKDINNDEGSGMLSTSTCMIPFIEHNEGARIMMAASQAKQMLPLKNPQPPAVQSGYESILTNYISDSFVKKSRCNGKVVNIVKDSINILCKDNKIDKIDISPSHLKSGSGKDTLSVFVPKVKVGDTVENGEIIAEGACVSGGSISLGRTLLVAIMPYKGYNFEDGIVINERLIDNDKLTSLHGVTEEVLVSEKDRVLSIVEIGTRTKKGEILIRKTIGEIEDIIGFDEEDETSELSAGQYIKKSSGGIVVDIEVYCNTNESKFPKLQHLIKKTKEKYGVLKNEKFTIRGESIKGILIRFKIEQELKIGLGDKLCNRYGNKGIISLIEKEENMPLTPWGEPVDIVTNPLGIPNRMNVGQVYELYCGLISSFLAKYILSSNNQSKSLDLLKKILPNLDGTKDKKFSSDFLNNFSNLSKEGFNNLLQQLQNNKFFPIIIPPFKSPSKEGIKNCLKILNLKSGYNLYLPEFKVRTRYPVPIGYTYFCKLEHIGDLKLHGRSTGPVAAKTSQPLAGKRREGGQRMGEAETFVLAGNNCPMLLSEFMGPLSDDITTKNEIISEIVQNGQTYYKPARSTPTKDLLNSLFIALMLAK